MKKGTVVKWGFKVSEVLLVYLDFWVLKDHWAIQVFTGAMVPMVVTVRQDFLVEWGLVVPRDVEEMMDSKVILEMEVSTHLVSKEVAV